MRLAGVELSKLRPVTLKLTIAVIPNQSLATRLIDCNWLVIQCLFGTAHGSIIHHTTPSLRQRTRDETVDAHIITVIT